MGSQIPRIHVMPESRRTLGGVAIDFMAEHDMVLDEWQENVMNDWLALDNNGKFAASTNGLSAPRQTGKTYVLKGRCYTGMCVLGETILYTAHEVKTSRKTFDEMAADFDIDTGYPDLAEQVDYIRRANGQEEIRLKDWQDDDGNWHEGGRIIFSARSRGAARGFTADLFVADEAQELTGEQMAALLPTISAGQLQNNQTILIGTPPAPNQIGEIFTQTRNKALSDSPGKLSWNEWSVSEVGDVTDWQRVFDTNPSLDTRLMRSAVEAEMATMPPDYFARERLGWWSSVEESQRVITEAQWNSCLVESRPSEGIDSLGIKYSADGSTVSVSVCRKDGDAHFVELLFNEPTSKGTAWLVDFIIERTKKYACAVIDGQYGAQSLMDRLDGQVPRNFIIRPKIADVISAHTTFKDYVGDGRIQHTGQPQLANSVTKSSKRAIGKDGGFGWKSNEAADASIVESAALAVHGSDKTKRNPNRKTGVAF